MYIMIIFNNNLLEKKDEMNLLLFITSLPISQNYHLQHASSLSNLYIIHIHVSVWCNFVTATCLEE